MSREMDDKYYELRQVVEQQAGQRLPGERELAHQLGIPRSALRGLLDMLEGEGLVRRQQGSGTYAVDTEAKRLRAVVLLIDEELKLGEDPFFSLLVEYLQGSIQAKGAQCLIKRVGQNWQFQHEYDGAITLGQVGKRLLAQVKKGVPPVVGLLVEAKIPAGAPASVFQLADREAGAEAVRYLLTAGCTRIFFLGKRDRAASRERLAGVEEALRETGVPLQFFNCSLNYTAGLKLGQSLPLPADAAPPGIIAANDWLAVGLRAGLFRHPSSGQREIPLVSFDGLPITADPILNIQALAVPLQTIAADAVAELERLLSSAPGRVVSYALHWRE
jgi:DNA-binding LacI/PurR family transcriptional regulator